MDRFKFTLIIVLVVAVIAATAVLWPRVRIEAENESVQLVMDYDLLRNRALSRDYDLDSLLKKLRESGLTSLALQEETVGSLEKSQRIITYTGAELRLVLNQADQAQIVPRNTYIRLLDDSAGFIEAALGQRLGASRVSRITAAGQEFIAVSALKEDVAGIHVGFDPKDLETISRSGLGIVPVFNDYARVEPDQIRSEFQRLAAAGPLHGVLFAEPEVLGYPTHLGVTREELKNRNLPVGLVMTPNTLLSNIEVKGQNSLVKDLGYQAVRVFHLLQTPSDRVAVDRMVDLWVRSAKLHNIRMFYMHPLYLSVSKEREVELNLQYVQDIKAGLLEQGFKVGPARPFGELDTGHVLPLFLYLGLLAGGLLLLDAFDPKLARILWPFSLVFIVFYITLLSLDMLDTLQTLMATGGAIVASSLGTVTALREIGKNGGASAATYNALKFWLLASGISLIGALMVSAVMSESPFLIEMRYFRGVKLQYLAPLLVVGIYLIGYSVLRGPHTLKEKISNFLAGPVSRRDFLIFIVLVGVAALYIWRTGNTSYVSDLEQAIRDTLGRLFGVRPRTKEILIGHPALILAVYLYFKNYRKWCVPLFTIGTIGQLSIVNTFVHLRTELVLSLERALLGLGLGAAAGVLLILLWEFVGQRVFCRKVESSKR